jgi:hypothetical protein
MQIVQTMENLLLSHILQQQISTTMNVFYYTVNSERFHSEVITSASAARTLVNAELTSANFLRIELTVNLMQLQPSRLAVSSTHQYQTQAEGHISTIGANLQVIALLVDIN